MVLHMWSHEELQLFKRFRVRTSFREKHRLLCSVWSLKKDPLVFLLREYEALLRVQFALLDAELVSSSLRGLSYLNRSDFCFVQNCILCIVFRLVLLICQSQYHHGSPVDSFNLLF